MFFVKLIGLWLLIIKAIVIRVKTQIFGGILVYYLAKKYGMKAPKIRIQALPSGITGRHMLGVILVDIRRPSMKHIRKTIYHEFRHEWQMVFHPEVFKFFASAPEYETNFDFYINSLIEADARRFANTRGQEDDNSLIEAASLQELKDLYKRGQILPWLVALVSQFEQCHQ